MTRAFVRIALLFVLLAPQLGAAANAAPSVVSVDESPYMDSIGAAIPGPQWVRDDYEKAFANDEWAGIRWAYDWVTWSDIEVVPGLYDFSGLDGLVSSAHAHGLHLMMQVQTAADFVVPGPAQLLATGRYRTNSHHPLRP